MHDIDRYRCAGATSPTRNHTDHMVSPLQRLPGYNPPNPRHLGRLDSTHGAAVMGAHKKSIGVATGTAFLLLLCACAQPVAGFGMAANAFTRLTHPFKYIPCKCDNGQYMATILQATGAFLPVATRVSHTVATKGTVTGLCKLHGAVAA